MRESTDRGIWKSPEWRERSRPNKASRLNRAMRGEAREGKIRERAERRMGQERGPSAKRVCDQGFIEWEAVGEGKPMSWSLG